MPESSDDTSDSTPSLLRLDTAPFTLTADGQLSGLNERPTVDLHVRDRGHRPCRNRRLRPGRVPTTVGIQPPGQCGVEGTLSGTLSDEADVETPLAAAVTGQLAGVGIDYEGASLLRDLNADLTYDFELQEVKAGAVLED